MDIQQESPSGIYNYMLFSAEMHSGTVGQLAGFDLHAGGVAMIHELQKLAEPLRQELCSREGFHLLIELPLLAVLRNTKPRNRWVFCILPTVHYWG